jgi:hypothetical protein
MANILIQTTDLEGSLNTLGHAAYWVQQPLAVERGERFLVLRYMDATGGSRVVEFEFENEGYAIEGYKLLMEKLRHG